MKRLLYASLIAVSATAGLSSCMNGDYDADPASVNSTVNPLTQTSGNGSSGGSTSGNSSFNWNGTDPMSAKVDGTGFQAANYTYTGPGSFNAVIVGQAGDNSAISVRIPTNPTLNTPYSFSANLYANYFSDFTASNGTTTFTAATDGSGQIMILENDDAHIKGKFYFVGKNDANQTHTVTEGYFNVEKK